MSAQKRDEIGGDEAGVANLHGMADEMFSSWSSVGAALEAFVVALSDCGGGVSVAWQEGEEVFESRGVELEVGWELPEDWA